MRIMTEGWGLRRDCCSGVKETCGMWKMPYSEFTTLRNVMTHETSTFQQAIDFDRVPNPS